MLARILSAVSVVAVAIPPPAACQEQRSPPTIEEAIASRRSAAAELERKIDANPRDVSLWLDLLQLRGILLALELGLQPDVPPEERGARAGKQQEEIFERWRRADPKGTPPLLYRALMTNQENREAQFAAVGELAERFPTDPEVLKYRVSMLRERGLDEEIETLLLNAVAAAPEEPRFYGELHSLYQDRADTERADAMADAWLARAPGDFNANRAWYIKQTRTSAAPDTSLILEGSERLEGHDLSQWCAHFDDALVNVGQLPEALACHQRAVSKLAADHPHRAQATSQYVSLLGKYGDATALEQSLENQPADVRRRAVSEVAGHHARAGRCTEAARLATTFSDDELGGTPLLPSTFESCLDSPAFETLAPGWLARLDTSGLRHQTKILAGYFDVEQLEPILLRRLDRSSGQERETLYGALDVLYEEAGAFESRVALLGRWVKEDPEQTTKVVELAQLLAAEGNLDRAIGLLQELPPPDDDSIDSRRYETLVGLLVDAGRIEEAEATATAVATARQRGSYWGHLYLAEIALEEGRTDEALASYESFFGEAPVVDWVRAGGYLELLVEQDEPQRVVAHFERHWQRGLETSARPRGHHDEWLADQLAAHGLYREAQHVLEPRAAELGTVELWRKVASLAGNAEDWDGAERALGEALRLSPKDASLHNALARLELDRGDPAAAFAVLDRAFDQLEKPGIALWLTWTDAVLADDAGSAGAADQHASPSTEALLEAIEVLNGAAATELDESTKYLVHERLRELYELLAAAPDPASPKEPPP